ncbi:MAG: oxygenase MpaB family protein [Acidimicrobiales bacterium]
MSRSPRSPDDLGRDSLLARLAGDWRSMLPGSATGLLQLMHPGIGAGVAQHSAFFDAPFDRIYRSIPQIWAVVLAPDGAVRGRSIRDLHRSIKGTDDEGRRYHALDADTFWWAHATFTWDIFRSVQLFHARRLSARQCERLYGQTVTWYRRYGMSLRPVPADYGAFVAEFDRVCRTELEMTPAAARALSYSIDDPSSPVGASALLRALTPLIEPPARSLVVGCLPSEVRSRFDIPFGAFDQAQFRALCATLRTGFRLVPSVVNSTTFERAQRHVGARTRPQRFRPAS